MSSSDPVAGWPERWAADFSAASAEDPVAEWRKRWTVESAPRKRPPRNGPRSPWVYAGAAFGGTIAAIVATLLFCVVGVIVLAVRANGLDSTPNSLTYRNDTDHEVWIYECYGRCDEYSWGYWMDAGDEASFVLDWYGEGIEWVIVAEEDYSYGCIHIPQWEDQTIRVSSASKCPRDIHSPEINLA